MNGIKLLELALSVAPLMPSATAAPKACREWRLARLRWLEALEELNMREDECRDLASRQIVLHDMPETMS